MEWCELMSDAYGRVLPLLEKALEGLTQDDLNRQPHPDSNSIGWLTWHLTRVQDIRLSPLMGKEQLWISNDWYKRFHRPRDPMDRGFGHSSEEVAAFKSPDVQTLLGYHQAVLERTKRYIASLSTAELGRELDEPGRQPVPTVGRRLVDILNDTLQHAGQVAYLRGLFKGKGWLGL